MTSDTRWRRTLDHVLRQHGVIGRRELLHIGWTDDTIATAVRYGLLERVQRGTYAIPMSTPRLGRQVAAGLIAAGRCAALTSTTAGRLYGLQGLPRDDRVHVLVPHDRVVRRVDPSLVVRRSRIPDRDGQVIAGLAVTGPGRTVVELGRDLASDRLVEVVAHAVHEGLVTLSSLELEVGRCRGGRGLPTVREALRRLAPDDPRARARRERSTARLLVRHGLPRPLLGHHADVGGASPIELDLAYPEVRLGIEVDGGRWHHSPAQKRYDEVRQNRLTSSGWATLRFGEQQLDRQPRSVVRSVRAALLERGHPGVA